MNGQLGHRFALLATIWLLASPARAIIFGQFDNFQDGTLASWTGGALLSNQAGGGPDGAYDRYLQVSTGGSPGNLGVFNTAQWSGDYVTAGVTRINIDLKNSGPDPVSLRLMVTTTPGPGCTSTCTAWTSTTATLLPANDQWVRVEFSLAEPDLTRVTGTASYASSRAGAAKLHLRHDDGAPSPPGSQILVNSVLGVDNVVALPEAPRSSGLLAGMTLLLALFPRGNRRKHGNPVPIQW